MDSDNSVVVVKVENPFKRKLEDTELELALTESKAHRISGVMDSIVDNWLCPITLELPIDPVMAEDGKIYERSAIEQWLREKMTIGHIHPAYSLLEPVTMDSDNSVVVVKVENPFKRKLEDTESELALTERKHAVSERKARRISGVMDSIADNWLCPITLELPIDPVMAEDCKIYERSAIEQWLRTKRTSPSTNNHMGRHLFPATQAKSTIEALVKSGAVSDDKVKAWKAKLKNEKKVKKWREAAEGGDTDAMFQLAISYDNGTYGLPKDMKQAREWHKRGAELGNVECMGGYGECLLYGLGGDKVNALGLFYTSRAAQGGCCLSYLALGIGFAEGSYGLPQDAAQARVWLTKVITEGSDKEYIDTAEELLAELPPMYA
ncbi:hypothetical protein TrCOL_g4717 [Triparma columacea]|uniref:U-box domain-containing protein n=1 Tax=Triparma columacea TaxID=722753 RepID=A0A9W7LG56_9STRA|nr:hypothetical protein TrCOL_g4717 [Triparma columacea]